jgi:hypothetical protein
MSEREQENTAATHRKVTSPRGSTRCLIQVGILEDDHWRFSAQFEEGRFPIAARHLCNIMSSGRTASEVDLSNSRMGD